MSIEKKGFFSGLVNRITGGEAQSGITANGDKAEKAGFFERLKKGLSKTHESIIGSIDNVLKGKKQIDAETLEEIEEILITADVGVTTSTELISILEQRLKRNELQDAETLKKALKEEILVRLSRESSEMNIDSCSPYVIMVIGVNGVGKTTTIGKLAAMFRSEGKDVLLVAGDTFRAAAAEQLEIWAQRVGVDVVKHREGADPSAVVFDGCKAAVARKKDVVIVDTAGRLHTKVNLMDELKKIHRVMDREIAGAPHETLLILDASTGQNALAQARLFKDTAGVTGLAVTKLDGTAKGGIVVAIGSELGIPVRFIGVGEGIGDLRAFDPEEFVEALF
jgi:fused signal recognition particle receptor